MSRTLDARPDTVDFRDLMYVPTLVEVPQEIPLSEYQAKNVPILNQGKEGACTGFGLATVAHFLLRTRETYPDTAEVSPRMLYEMAKRHDEWPGEDTDGSSPRGAMKGWYKYGVCASHLWPYDVSTVDRQLTRPRLDDAIKRPLGAYYRVNHKDLVAMHCAIAEVGILYATSIVHGGWYKIKANGHIPISNEKMGAHAFAIVAYNKEGFWIQNSWGPTWGKRGFALVTYDDWLKNGTDIWVARLGAPVTLDRTASSGATRSTITRSFSGQRLSELRPHIISIGNDGLLKRDGNFGNTEEDVAEIILKDIPRITQKWKKKRVILYVHGGLVHESSAHQLIDEYRQPLLDAEVYPISFIWKTDFWNTLKNILSDGLRQRRPEGFLDDAKDFMLDRLDDALEPLARGLGGKAMWDEMKENALLASYQYKINGQTRTGGAALVLKYLAQLQKKEPSLEIHLAAHSAGSIFLAPVVPILTAPKGKALKLPPVSGIAGKATGLGLKIKTCTLWAPACTVSLFKDFYAPTLKAKKMDLFTLFTLSDSMEQDDDCANIYHKSLLYLVSNAFEEQARIPLLQDGVPILGMEKFIRESKDLVEYFKTKQADWVISPTAKGTPVRDRSQAKKHPDFDNDPETVKATLARILGQTKASKTEMTLNFSQSPSDLAERRKQIAG